MHNIAVIYLLREGNDPSVFQRFYKSYQKFDSGIKNSLILIRKGKVDRNLTRDFTTYSISDFGTDITAYRKVCYEICSRYTYVCFLNSFSEILAHNWLAYLYMPFLDNPKCGITGATGSYESMLSNIDMLPDTFLHPRLEKFKNKFFFNPFPNAHIRTNAFMVSAAEFAGLSCLFSFSRKTSYLFEASKWSMTNQIKDRFLVPYVINSDGYRFTEHEWQDSLTYRTGEQEKLLVADNQTRLYNNSDTKHKQLLEKLAWGVSVNNNQHNNNYDSRTDRKCIHVS